jgi:hypothetical protein
MSRITIDRPFRITLQPQVTLRLRAEPPTTMARLSQKEVRAPILMVPIATLDMHLNIGDHADAMWEHIDAPVPFPLTSPPTPAFFWIQMDIQMMLAAGCHLGTKNCDFQMERYIHKRRNDGTLRVNLLEKGGGPRESGAVSISHSMLYSIHQIIT